MRMGSSKVPKSLPDQSSGDTGWTLVWRPETRETLSIDSPSPQHQCTGLSPEQAAEARGNPEKDVW